MDKGELNRFLVVIAEKRMELSRLNYADTEYDLVEEELHNLEDDFVEIFGADMEKVLKEIHQKYCPELEVLSPIAYMAKSYHKIGKYKNGTAVYDIPDYKQGIAIDSKEYPQAHLVILPNPVRILLTAAKGKIKEEVWAI